MPLPPLDRDDLLAMLGPTPGSLHPRLPTALHWLTRGHPLGGSVLCEAVVHAAARRTVAPEQLLDLETPDGRPVTERLLEELIPPHLIRSHLVLLSLARDRDAAQALAAGHLPLGGGQSPAAAAARHLEEELWSGEGDRLFVADPFLRTLLVHELRRDSAPGGAGHRWKDLHGTLRDHHAGAGGTATGTAGDPDGPDGSGERPDVLRHTLATGDAGTVVLRLSGCFRRWEADRWLAALQYAATAPVLRRPSGRTSAGRWPAATTTGSRRMSAMCSGPSTGCCTRCGISRRRSRTRTRRSAREWEPNSPSSRCGIPPGTPC